MTTIHVTAGHIAAGVPGECAECPVALAILSTFPDLSRVAVGSAEIAVLRYGDRDWTDITAPREVTFFVLKFDGGRPVEPFSFDLDYPQEVAA